MLRFWLSHILLCGLVMSFFAASFAVAQTGNAGAQALSAPYQKWLDEDVATSSVMPSAAISRSARLISFGTSSS